MRITTYLREDIGKRLKAYIEKKYGSRHGTLSMVIERAIIEFLDREESGD